MSRHGHPQEPEDKAFASERKRRPSGWANPHRKPFDWFRKWLCRLEDSSLQSTSARIYLRQNCPHSGTILPYIWIPEKWKILKFAYHVYGFAYFTQTTIYSPPGVDVTGFWFNWLLALSPVCVTKRPKHFQTKRPFSPRGIGCSGSVLFLAHSSLQCTRISFRMVVFEASEEINSWWSLPVEVRYLTSISAA